VQALAEGGVTVAEVTFTVPNAMDVIREAKRQLGDRVLLGAGTVLDAEAANRAIDAGARFIVSPVCRTALIETCHRRDVAVLPGCYSPTEILTAWAAGADFVKVFPARSLSPAFIRDVREPLPQVKLIPTGGITAENAADWLDAGVAAVGVGGALLDRGAIAAGRFEVVEAAARRLVAAVHQ
jgi:2-dehydro-3-deoxyphosphogluconate aldolase/(4S)-4-hydroxy-2-oxoglutarate aldolase